MDTIDMMLGTFGYTKPKFYLAANESGYSTQDDKETLADHMLSFAPPYRCDVYDHIKWVEFCRALMEYDFTPMDEFTLNGIHFRVEAL